MPDRMYDIHLRARLCKYLATQGGTIKREVSIGNTRADIVRMTNQIEGYEIKGDTDPVHSKRFTMQIEEYSKICDRCWLVISENGTKADAAMKVIPNWWGLITICDQIVIRRMAQRNKLISPRELAGEIWKVDLVRLLRSNEITFKGGLPTKRAITKIVAEHLHINTIRQEVIRQWTDHKSNMRPQDLGKRNIQ